MTITLPVTLRDDATSVAKIRSEGNIPAVAYGPNNEPVSIFIEEKAFAKVRKEAGESTIVELTGLENKWEVLIKGMEFSPVRQEILHVDFYAVDLKKEMTTNVALEFIGEAPAEKANEGSVTKVLHEVEVTCMPADLPSHIDVDLTALVAVDSKIFVKDLEVGKGVTVTAEGEEPVVIISAARQEVVEEEVTEVDMDAIEVEQKGKDEAEEEKAE
ncbi:MAG: 50S ribosomal protein L25 [Candidatus Pacebacteria bacterium]|nr:50S ribosomal protein L25 [Candidatus Paceibacterota bacterium]